jgi:hypothetical protein
LIDEVVLVAAPTEIGSAIRELSKQQCRLGESFGVIGIVLS